MENDVKKVAILHCKRSGKRCTGASCFRTFYDRQKAFAQYGGKDVELSAYFDCNGCETDKLTDPNFAEKLDRLKKENVDKIHIATCVVCKCEYQEQIRQAITEHGLTYEEGTH